jgi:hypothetical protein
MAQVIPITAAPALNWAHAPSPFAWSVMCYGGLHPRTGFEQPQLEVQFARRTRPNGFGHTSEGILYRANDYAKMQHRTHFAVRGDDGLLYDGPVMGEVEFGRLTGGMVARKFKRQERRAGGR